ncbi:hypothetical protein GCM10010326_49890 [Streptomyces xanthochromogenes]|uniref:Antitoxin n=2 Tax=Streptomyces TaxID=1883 RepID=A0ABQ3AFJ2_9ACTN|nr:hypothetical protein GCM10010326_49890 [Streptomyces xanthochromogenes]
MTGLPQLASPSQEFDERVALKAVDLTVRAGKPVALVGPNGQHPEADAQIVDGSGAGRVRRRAGPAPGGSGAAGSRRTSTASTNRPAPLPPARTLLRSRGRRRPADAPGADGGDPGGVAGLPRPRRTAMSVMDKLKQMLKGHEDQAGQGIDKAGDFVDEKTQGKYSSQVDTAQDKLRDELGRDQGQPPQP